MVENVMNMADGIADMVVYMVGMIEDMYDRIESTVEMVSIVAVGGFGATMEWVHSMNSVHTFDHLQEIANFDLETYLEVLALAAMVSLCPCNTRFPSLISCHITVLQNLNFRTINHIMMFSTESINLDVF